MPIVLITNLRYRKYTDLPHYFLVDRNTPLGNPFFVSEKATDAERKEAVLKYKKYFKKKLKKGKDKEFNNYLEKIYQEYKKCKLVVLHCWCFPRPCHSEIIKNYLEKRLNKEEKNVVKHKNRI